MERKNQLQAQLVKCSENHCFAKLGEHYKGWNFSFTQFPVFTEQKFSYGIRYFCI